MKMYWRTLGAMAVTLASACSQPAPAPAAEDPAAAAPPPAPAAAEIKMTELPPFSAGPYQVQPKFEDELADGHFNLFISGGEVAAVRLWVGDEQATGALVAKAEIENDYHHAHAEVPNPIPDGAKLWVEIESPAGEVAKGSTDLK